MASGGQGKIVVLEQGVLVQANRNGSDILSDLRNILFNSLKQFGRVLSEALDFITKTSEYLNGDRC